jgi:LDH2 family malate/lactate/ureidoglycolate dehydrogenase
VRSARPLDPGAPVRMPFERSARARAERLQAGWIELPEAIHAQLQTLRAPAGVAP